MAFHSKRFKRQLASQQGAGSAPAAAYDPIGEANSYKAALERAAYGDAGAQYGQGLGQISNYLAARGPLADSGAATALRAGLASQIYGAANSRIGGAYANMLGQNFAARRNAYFQQILNQQQKPRKKKWYEYAAGAIGGALPFVGGAFGGGGGGGQAAAPYQASDAYYG